MKVRFQILDMDYFVNNNKPVIRIYGKTRSGKTIVVFFDKFKPYFYVKYDKEKLQNLLNEIEKMHKIKIQSIKGVKRKTPFGYKKEKETLLKVITTLPADVPKIREFLFEKGLKEIYEADILFKYRFMVDHGLYGMQWAEADVEKTFTKTVRQSSYHAKTIKPIDVKTNAKLKYMAFDIECLPSSLERTIDSKTDPIIIISLNFEPSFRDKKSLVLIAKPFSDKDVEGFEDEKQMLERFAEIIHDYDPDIITGYNVNNFDIPYVVDRFRQLNIPCNLGRCTNKPVFIKTFGTFRDATIVGRVVADPYQILKRDPWTRLHRYTLETVAKVMLNDEKKDVKYSEMESLWKGSRKDLKRFIAYARKDAELSLRLVLEKGLLVKFFELAKISGVLLQSTFGGQTVRIETMLLHEFRKRGFVMPSMAQKLVMAKRKREREKSGLKGATVLEPKKGLHTSGCVLVLDFTSLYPSIIRTYNVSPDTIIINDSEKNVYVSPIGTKFIDSNIYEGILPFLLKELLEARSLVKKKLKKAEGEEKRLLNARQLALKDMSNSFYGYTGYIRSRLYMLDIANTITAYGRKNLIKTKELVEKNFDVEVVYGDTDSIFVKTKLTNLDESRELGEKISEFITDKLPGILELKFEKIYRTFLILTKKRYAGWKFEQQNGKWVDEIDMRGIETVRRDWCPLVTETMRKVIEVVLKEGDLTKTLEIIRNVIDKIKMNEVPIEKLTIVKGITKNIDSYEGVLPHIEVAKKIKRRNPQNPPLVGERIGFVIIKGNQMLSKRAEDPEYVKEKGLKIDPEYYIHSQLLPPIERILEATGITKSEILGNGRQVTIKDVFNGKKRKMKQKIDVNYSKKTEEDIILKGWEGFVCEKCKKSYRRIPLQGFCDCGGKILISYHGSMGSKCERA